MSEYAEKHRSAMRDKAHRLANGDPHQKVDASDWTPPEPLNADVKTGLRPISQRQHRRGGKVHGEQAKHHAGRKARKSGGRLGEEIVNRDVREANKERDGTKHVGGFKSGGRPKRASGGVGLTPEEAAAAVPTGRMSFQNGPSMLTKAAGLKKGGKASHSDEREDKALVRKMVKGDALKREKRGLGGLLGSGALGLAAEELANRDRDKKRRGGMSVSDGEIEGTRPTGGRKAHKHGGKAGKGKMNVNIIIAQPGPEDRQAPPVPMGGPPMPPPPVHPPIPAGGPGLAAAGLPPGSGPMPPMPPMGPGGAPMMPRKRGGRTYPHMTAGALSGEGRLEKIKAYGKEARDLDGHY